jgi:peptidoglycan hydrolase-like protein with peptidoglycan-binding domain
MVNDSYEPLAKVRPAGFSRAFLAAIDAGLKLRAADRPQSISEWRSMLGPTSTPEGLAAVVSPERKRSLASWMGLATVVVLVAAGGGYYLATSQPSAPVIAVAPTVSIEKVVPEKSVQTAPADQRQQQEREVARLRAEAAARAKAEEEPALQRQAEEEAQRKIAAETAEKKRMEEEAKQKVAAEAAAKLRTEDDARKVLEADEAALQLRKVDRQHIQVAMVALGFGASSMDGTLGPRTREMIAAWQKARNQTATGFLTAPQIQGLLKEAATAVSKFDDEQKKIDEELRKAAAGKTSVNHDIVPLEDNKRITLYLARGQKCDATANYIARFFANRLELQFIGGWQTFEADKAGDFARSFPSPVSGAPLLVKGNLKTRVVSVENVPRCLWKGSF